VEVAIERWGRIDVLIANAAISDFGPIAEADPELWRVVIVTNVLGVMFAVRATLPHMLKAGCSRFDPALGCGPIAKSRRDFQDVARTATT
jgi:NAD(P)-dependent dehydrogenase (short-subunit alcohol dehydrogenase family)